MRMRKILGLLLCGAVFSTTHAGEDAKKTTATDNAERKINQYINGNLFGIQNIKKDANKRIISLVSIGRAPISSAATRARAKNQAFKKADAYARAEFMKWLTTSVVYTRIDQDDVAIVQKGESLGDEGKGQASETSEATEFSFEQTISVASGFVKGMVQIGSGINDDGEAVVILGWSVDSADQTDMVREKNLSKRSFEKGGEERSVKGLNSLPEKALSVSDSANDFL